MLPDAVLDALGDAVRDVRREGEREIERISAETRAAIAELRAENAELRSALRAIADEQVTRVASALVSIKDGAPGRDGRDADPVDMARVEHLIEAKFAAVAAAIPIPKDGRDGTDGASIELEFVERMVSDQVASAFATMPIPQDGRSPGQEELEPIVDAAVQRAFASVSVPKDGQDGVPGRNGKDADPVTHEQISESIKSAPELFEEAVSRYLAANPPKDGRDGDSGEPGPAGKDADPVTKEQIVEAVLSCSDGIQDAVAKHLALNPPPAGRNGIDGKDGAAGENGIDGKDADPIDYDGIQKFVTDRISIIPVPKDGRDGIDGNDADPIDYDGIHKFVVERIAEIPVPKDGKNGIDGKNGVGLTGGLIDRSGALVVTLSDGTVRDLGCVVGKDADLASIREMVRTESLVVKATAASGDELVLPAHFAGMMDMAHRALSDPLVVRADEPTAPAITLNVAGGSSPKTVSKTIHTRRDEKGNITADVVENTV